MHKEDYQNAAKIVKPRVARRIVHAIRHSNLGARFLRKDPHTNMWQDVGDKIASEKTSQALREKSPEEKKQALKEKVNEDTTAVGISMPHLQLVNGEGVIVLDTQHPAAIDTGNGIYAASGMVHDPNNPIVMVTANASAAVNASAASQASRIIVPATENAGLHQPISCERAIIETHLEMIDNSDLEITSPDFKRLKRSDEEEDTDVVLIEI